MTHLMSILLATKILVAIVITSRGQPVYFYLQQYNGLVIDFSYNMNVNLDLNLMNQQDSSHQLNLKKGRFSVDFHSSLSI